MFDFCDKSFLSSTDDDKNTELRLGYNPGLREAKTVVKKGYAKAVIAPLFKFPDDCTD